MMVSLFYLFILRLNDLAEPNAGGSFFKGSANLLQTRKITPLEHLHNCIGVSLDLREAMHHGDIPYRVDDPQV
jgi:hypothetical protein